VACGPRRSVQLLGVLRDFLDDVEVGVGGAGA